MIENPKNLLECFFCDDPKDTSEAIILKFLGVKGIATYLNVLIDFFGGTHRKRNRTNK